MYNYPNDRERAALLRIAAAITGSSDESGANGNRIAGALERLADWFEANTLATGAGLPEVSASDNGAVLKVANGVWSIGSEAEELPAVTADDDGAVLAVVNGAWAAVQAEAPSDPDAG